MRREEIEEILAKLPEKNDLRVLQDWKIQANGDMHNIKFQMDEFKRKDNKRKKMELAERNTYDIDDDGEKKYNRQRLAYNKRVELTQRIDMRIGEIRRQKEMDYYHMYHAVARRVLDEKTQEKIHKQALKESNNE